MVRSQTLIRSLTDIAEHICQIKKKCDWNVLPKRANEHFFASGRSNWKVDAMGIEL